MGLCSSNLQPVPATVELQDFDFTLYGMASAPWTTASACQDSLYSGVYILMAESESVQNKMLRLLKFIISQSKWVFKKFKNKAIYYLHTYCFSETIHSTKQNKVMRKRTAITARIFTRGFENKV